RRKWVRFGSALTTMRLYAAGDIVRLDCHLRLGFPGARQAGLLTYDEGSAFRLTLRGVPTSRRIIEYLIRRRAEGAAEVSYDELATGAMITRRDVGRRLGLPEVGLWLTENGVERIARRGRGNVGRLIFPFGNPKMGSGG
ncbi:hypothetical protein, partial [Acuticoccus mangrovi]|uniref:hypothetical protein n=1 Tax=Acuticoccus mangrovi TaxID=2796142 RepID=UPI001B3BF0A5